MGGPDVADAVQPVAPTASTSEAATGTYETDETDEPEQRPGAPAVSGAHAVLCSAVLGGSRKETLRAVVGVGEPRV
jgi:hypothetical protein